MAIVSAEIEANGWVLRVTLTGALGSFASYALDAGGVPRVVVSATHAGFVKAGGAAVPGALVRELVAGIPVRRPVDPAAATVKVIDEIDLGGGVIRCRLALSETVYASDTALSLTVRDGWRTGEAAAAGIAVVNNSSVVAAVPIMRWALPAYERVTGVFRLSLVVASHHPAGFDPVTGVRFTVTDGVTTKAVWATALATDDSYGDGLRCHTVLVDPAGLNAGLLRCDAEVYPWLGAMRSTDAAGTRSMAGLALAGLGNRAEVPFVVGHDPVGTRYGGQFAFVDPVNGTVTASVAMIGTSRAAAKAVAPAARPRDVSTAIQAARLLARVLPAANGGTAATGSIDGLVVTLAAGVHAGFGTATVGTVISVSEIPVTIEGDPDDGEPRANCVLRTPATTGGNPRTPRLRFRNLRMEIGNASYAGTVPAYLWFDNVELRGKGGLETATTAPFLPTAVTGNVHYTVTRSRVWRTGWDLNRANAGVGLLRASEFSRRAAATVFLKNRWIPKSEDGFTAANTQEGMATWLTTTQVGPIEDVIAAWNDMRSLHWQGWTAATPPAASLSGTLNPSHRRHVLLNNVFERIVEPSTNMFSYGEGVLRTMSYIIVEGNTVAGAGYNAFYSDPTPTTPAESNTLLNDAFVIRHANNATDRNASKQDDFADPNTQAVRGGAGQNGYRPHMIEAWGPHMGVGMEGHVDCARTGTITNFRRDYPGVRGVQFEVATPPGWSDDRSERGSNTGGGNYVPGPGSVLLGRAVRGNSDRDLVGVARRVGGAAGAYEATVTELLPAGSLVAQRAAAAVVSAAAVAAPAAGRMAMRSGVVIAGMALALAPAAGAVPVRGGAAMLSGAVALVPAGGRVAVTAGMAAIGVAAAGSIGVANGRLRLSDAAVLLLPDGDVPALRTLTVRIEPRDFSIG